MVNLKLWCSMRNRWLIAAAAVGIHISLGSVYAWSVFKKPFIDAFGWSDFEAGLPFGLAIFLLGTSAAVMGHIIERRGGVFQAFYQHYCGLLASWGRVLQPLAPLPTTRFGYGFY